MSDIDEMAYDNATRPAVSKDRLVQFVERVERLEEEKAGIAADIKDIYAEAKSAGYDTKALRKVIRERKLADQERREQAELVELYKSVLGMED